MEKGLIGTWENSEQKTKSSSTCCQMDKDGAGGNF